MQVRDVMRRNPRVTSPGASLAQAGSIMDEANCGVLPVVGDGEEERVVGMITDRDIGLGLATRNRKPADVTVREVISGEVYACKPGDAVGVALTTMRDRLVRRLPVIDGGGHLVGIVTLDDLVVAAHPALSVGAEGPSYADVAITLKAIARQEQRQVPE